MENSNSNHWSNIIRAKVSNIENFWLFFELSKDKEIINKIKKEFFIELDFVKEYSVDNIEIIAKRLDNDDIIVQFISITTRYFIYHLTYSRHSESHWLRFGSYLL